MTPRKRHPNSFPKLSVHTKTAEQSVKAYPGGLASMDPGKSRQVPEQYPTNAEERRKEIFHVKKR